MDLKEQLVDSSRIIGDVVAERVGNNEKLFAEIFDLSLYEGRPMSSRAGRVLNLCVEKYPYLILPHLDKIFDEIKKGKLLHRCFLKIFAEEEIPMNEEQQGLLLDACFEWLQQSGQEVAVQIFSMTILLKFAKKEPDLSSEIIEAINNVMPLGTPGVKNRGQRIMKELQKPIK